MEQLLALVPEKTGLILDVACGLGGTTRCLLKYYSPSQVFGIDISEKQLASSRQHAPGCTFELMDAARLRFDDNQFDTIICVEGAPHFNTRELFLHEAFRVLKPGGRLVVADVLFHRLAMQISGLFPIENCVLDVHTYSEHYERAGFTDSLIVDATQNCANGFYHGWFRMGYRELRAHKIPLYTFAGGLVWLSIKRAAVKRYLIVSARKAPPPC